MPFPESFVTARLRAERLRPDHHADIHRMHQDAEQMALLGGPRDEAQTAAYMERNLRHWVEYGFGLWILRDVSDGEVAGRALLRHLLLDGADEVEVGYSLAPRLWGRGLAPEVTAACLGFARRDLALPSVVALTRPENTRSQRVLAKVGMRMVAEIQHEELPHLLFRTPVGWSARVP